MTPPHIENTRMGPRLDMVTNPSISADSLRLFISHRRPAISDHIPRLEKTPPSQNKRYSWYLNAAKAWGLGVGGMSGGWPGGNVVINR